jgi:hypothetical protein
VTARLEDGPRTSRSGAAEDVDDPVLLALTFVWIVVVEEDPEVVGQLENVIAVEVFFEFPYLVQLVFLDQSIHNVLKGTKAVSRIEQKALTET